MACFCHLASVLTNNENKAENLAVYCQACIYKSAVFYQSLILICRQSDSAKSLSGSQSSPTMPNGSQKSSILSSLYLGLKAVQPCRVGLKTVQPCWVLIWVLRQFNRTESLFEAQGSPIISSPYLKLFKRLLEVIQLITNYYYPKRKGMLSINR